MSEDRISGDAMNPDVDTEAQPLPYKRNPTLECQMCWAPPLAPCDPYCLALLPADEQVAHRDAVLARTLDELELSNLDRMDRVGNRHVATTECRLPRRPASAPRRRWRVLLAIAALVLVLAAGALWAAQRAKAETFDVCPSGVSGVASFDTSCAFADAVRASFYWQPSWTIFAKSPVTGKIYTMQCARTDTSGTGWYDSKRCFGVNDAGAVLIVFIA